MIISENREPSLQQFQDLMHKVDDFLNKDALYRTVYYQKRSGTALEEDVYHAVCTCAKGSPFENSISLVSGKQFPDIVAHQYYGIEVKSTQGDKWTSIGSSILESTRIPNIERIFLTFGKLGGEISFLSRPYEDCLSDIAVTHYPRYKIDMQLEKGNSIFDKMAMPYDTLRNLDNPILPVANYYKAQLKKGESLWWTSDNVMDEVAPPKVRHWKVIDRNEREMLTAQAYAFFPESILSNHQDKYDRFALWLATNHGVINTSLRDSFSAGGKQTIVMKNGKIHQAPAVLKRIENNIEAIKTFIFHLDEEMLSNFWGRPIEQDRINQWEKLVLSYCRSSILAETAFILNKIVTGNTIYDNWESVTRLAEQAGSYTSKRGGIHLTKK